MSYSKFHRWLGLLLAPFVVLISVTGVLLNHTHRLDLAKVALPDVLAQSIYGVAVANRSTVFSNQSIAIDLDSGAYLFVRDKALAMPAGSVVGFCEGGVSGVEQLGQTIVVACANKLLLLSEDGILLEEQGASLGMPTPFEAIAKVDGALLLRHDAAVWTFDPDSLVLTRIEPAQIEAWAASGVLSTAFFQTSLNGTDDSLTLERLLLDLHSGRWLGEIGVLLTDLVAISLIAMVVSGLIAWRKRLQSN